jgi:enoyl-CoA hydratase/carnithine racemase
MEKQYTYLLVEIAEGIAIITLNRIKEMNALSRSMCRELSDAMEWLQKDPRVNALLVTGGTDFFCAGIDINELIRLNPSEYKEYFEPVIDYYIDLYDFPKPMVAAVSGIAMGGGFNLALSCDFIVASTTAIFAHPEIKFGLNPIFDPLWRRVGLAKAKEIAMTGEPIGAKEAEKIGLVNRVVEPERVMEEGLALARSLAEKSPKVLTMIKRISDLVHRLDRRSAIEHEVELSALLLSYEETRNNLEGFLEALRAKKRK